MTSHQMPHYALPQLISLILQGVSFLLQHSDDINRVHTLTASNLKMLHCLLLRRDSPYTSMGQRWKIKSSSFFSPYMSSCTTRHSRRCFEEKCQLREPPVYRIQQTDISHLAGSTVGSRVPRQYLGHEALDCAVLSLSITWLQLHFRTDRQGLLAPPERNRPEHVVLRARRPWHRSTKVVFLGQVLHFARPEMMGSGRRS